MTLTDCEQDSPPELRLDYVVLPASTEEIPIAVPTWDEIRQIIIGMQGGICARVGCDAAPVTRSGMPRLEVVAMNDGKYAALCRSCRLRGDGALRAAKGAETKRARRGHRRLFRSDRAAAPGKRSVLALLHIEAVTLAHWGRSTPTMIEIAASMTAVLFRRGYLKMDPHNGGVGAGQTIRALPPCAESATENAT